MNQKYNEQQKQEIIKRYQDGISVAEITADTGIPRSTVYAWIKEAADSQSDTKTVSVKNFRLLENKVALLEGIIEILQNVACRADDPLDVKLYALEEL